MSELKKQVCFALYSASNAVMRAYRYCWTSWISPTPSIW